MQMKDELEQYAKWFRLHGMDFDVTYSVSRGWLMVAFPSLAKDGRPHYTRTRMDTLMGYSGWKETLDEAMVACFVSASGDVRRLSIE